MQDLWELKQEEHSGMERAGGHEVPPLAEELLVFDNFWGDIISFL